MKARSISSAFTLVELLVVIAIIAILAGLIMPAISKVLDNANATKCAANLQQVGTGINAYATDNDGYLPGPLAISQYPLPGGSSGVPDDQLLFKRLAKYLGLDDSANATSDSQKKGNVLICPAYQKIVPTLAGPSYVLNPRLVAGPDQPAFGDPDGGKDPLKKALLSTWVDTTDGNGNSNGSSGSTPAPVDLTRTWAMKDADQQAFTGINTKVTIQGSSAMAAKPVHGDFRNALFFDWHVGRLSADAATNDQPK